jgi:RNA polymerase sigma factor (sigma-70 family)
LQIDPTILKGCLRNDRKAQAALYKRCFNLLMGVCVRYVKNDEEARALLNTGFLKILTHLDRYRKEVPFEAWSRRIMINTIIDQYRRDKKHRDHMVYTDFNDREQQESFFDYNQADQQFDVEELMELVRQLPPMTQQVFNLFAIDGFSHQEIGEMLDISVGTSKWHVSSARKSMIQKLQKKMKAKEPTL